MEKNENKKRLFENKKITVIAVIAVVIAIAVTVMAIIVPQIISKTVQEIYVSEKMKDENTPEDISSDALSGYSFPLNANTSLTSLTQLSWTEYNNSCAYETSNPSLGSGSATYWRVLVTMTMDNATVAQKAYNSMNTNSALLGVGMINSYCVYKILNITLNDKVVKFSAETVQDECGNYYGSKAGAGAKGADRTLISFASIQGKSGAWCMLGSKFYILE